MRDNKVVGHDIPDHNSWHGRNNEGRWSEMLDGCLSVDRYVSDILDVEGEGEGDLWFRQMLSGRVSRVTTHNL